MKITLESTTRIATIKRGDNTMAARLWTGTTDTGIPVHALIATLSPQTHDVAALAEFERELGEAFGDIELVYFDNRPIDIRFVL